MKLGFVGLGNMGAPMATRLLAWPDGLVVCDVRADATVPFAAAGATVADSPEAVAAVARIISVTVLDDAQVRQVVDGMLRSAAPGTVIAVHSTISDETAVELGTLCSARGVEFLDAPVSGGKPAAARGELAVLIGGSPDAFAAVREPFALFGGLVVHAGGVGAGTRMKLARNLLHFVSFAAAAEAQRLAEQAGIDLPTLGKVVRHTDAITGGAGAIMLRDSTSPLDSDDFWYPIMTHVRDLGEKDLALALGLGDRLDVELPLARIALDLLGPGLGVGSALESKGVS